MLRIVGVQRSVNPQNEFVLLQNHGSLRAVLRGHVILGDCVLEGGDLGDFAFAFSDCEPIPPGLYVLLTTGVGSPHWTKTRDGFHVFHTFMNRNHAVWNDCEGPLHVLTTQHTYCTRKQEPMLIG